MGQNLSKYGDNGLTNFAKELNINVDNIILCEHLKLEEGIYNTYKLNIDSVKFVINSMNVCNYKQTNYVYNTKNRIRLIFNTGEEFIIALSDCGQYSGIPTSGSGWGIWFYLKTPQNSVVNLFNDLIYPGGSIKPKYVEQKV